MSNKAKLTICMLVLGTGLSWLLLKDRSASNSGPYGDSAAEHVEPKQTAPVTDRDGYQPAVRVAEAANVPEHDLVDVGDSEQDVNPLDLGELWTRIDGVSTGLFSGTATVEDVCQLSESLLSRLDGKAGALQADGTTIYKIEADPQLGNATLIVDPSRQGTVEQYELRVDSKLATGYQGNINDVDGSKLQMWFGDRGEGAFGFKAHVEANVRIGDMAVWTANSNVGPFPEGGTLSHKGSDIYWRESHAEAQTMPDGKPGWTIGYRHSKPVLVSQGGIPANGIPAIQSILSNLGN